MDVRLRQLGNALSVLGYLILIHVDPLAGSLIKTLGFFLVVPFILKTKMYDLLGLAAFFIAIDISNVIKHLHY